MVTTTKFSKNFLADSIASAVEMTYDVDVTELNK